MNQQLMSPIVVAILAALGGCGKDDDSEKNNANPDARGAAGTSFQCSEDKNAWEQCVDDKVQYCHIVTGMEPHFHWGADCQSLGYQCLELSQQEAACLDEDSTCTVGDTKCEDNTAYQCVDHDGQGHWTVDPCGTAATCREHDGEVHCEKAETTFDPQDACDAMASTSAEEKSVVTAFDDVFSPDYHAELGLRIHVTLPDDQPSYIHFPVFSCGEFAVFLDQAGVFDGIQRRDQTDMTVSGGSAVELCSSAVPEHWHADLEWDGDGTEGTDPVPYVIRFQAVSGGQAVDFSVFQTTTED
jgi:hypothetical protein